jgi:catechol 2,3-dioxygenase-like lactoylglutathione lyase family enzyme
VPHLHHVAVNVESLDRAVPFYVALGFSSVSRWDDNGVPTADVADPLSGVRIELKQAFVPGPGDRLGHVAIVVDDIDAAHAVVNEHGGTTQEIHRAENGSAYFFGHAPDGARLEIRIAAHAT